MRQVQKCQMQLGELDIAGIRLDPKSRDDIPQVLRGLQWIYLNAPVREKIFALLEERIRPGVDKNTGRPGMDCWKILVMGVLRLTLNWDYDALHEHVNQHRNIRQMLGHADWYSDEEYQMQTIKDNVRWLTPELLDEINQIVVNAGHALLKKKESEMLRGRVDSFVVETHVHYPTDTNLLWDAMRVIIRVIAEMCMICGRSDWRQHAYHLRQIKRLMRVTQNKKRSRAKQDKQKEKREAEIIKAHREYIERCQCHLQNAKQTLSVLETGGKQHIRLFVLKETLETFMQHAERQIDQIQRRVLLGEIIPHEEKVFSLFEPHTEWISKGKAGVPQELGLRVCIVEDQHQFILHHRVMEKNTDDQVAITMVQYTKRSFPQLHSCSFDKGFHSPENQRVLQEALAVVALPRKGKRSKQAELLEASEEFKRAKEKHSAVESAINALEVHGLDVCPDHGIDGFKRYVSLAVLARNIQRIGAILKTQEQKRLRRKKRKLVEQATLPKAA